MVATVLALVAVAVAAAVDMAAGPGVVTIATGNRVAPVTMASVGRDSGPEIQALAAVTAAAVVSATATAAAVSSGAVAERMPVTDKPPAMPSPIR